MSDSVAFQKNTVDALFALLRSEIFGGELSDAERALITDDCVESLYACSKQHDLVHVIGTALERNGMLRDGDPITLKFQKQQMTAIYRYEQINYELAQIDAALTEAKIAFLPLKGAVVRELYPEPWMRTSCDIDVLVHEEDLGAAMDALKNALGYRTKGARGFHDVSLYSEGGTHLELHFNVLENMSNIDRLLARVWEFAAPETEGSFRYRLNSEFFAFHLLSHMSYHFITGGCGIRSFVDLCLWRGKVGYDETVLEEMCRECEIDAFACAAFRLAGVWFSGNPSDELCGQMQDFILRGGVYGSLENKVSVQQTRKGGKLKYLLSRIFGSYEMMKHRYPILVKHRWLMPFCQVHRWCCRLVKGDFDRAAHELSANQKMTKRQVKETAEFLEKLGLHSKQ